MFQFLNTHPDILPLVLKSGHEIILRYIYGPCIFMLYIIRKYMCFFDTLSNKGFLRFFIARSVINWPPKATPLSN